MSAFAFGAYQSFFLWSVSNKIVVYFSINDNFRCGGTLVRSIKGSTSLSKTFGSQTDVEPAGGD